MLALLLSLSLGANTTHDTTLQHVFFNEPTPGLIFSLYNVDFPYSRLSHFRMSCGFWNGVSSQDQLWKLDKTVDSWGNDTFFMQSVKYPKDRLAFHNYGWREPFCYSASMYQDQAWVFKPIAANSTKFRVVNSKNGCRLYNWRDGRGGVTCQPKIDHDLFQLRSPFAAADGGPMFRIADSFYNELDTGVDYTFRYETGFSKAIADSIAVSGSFSATLSITIWACLILAGFSSPDSLSIAASVGAAFERSTTKSYLRAEKIQYTIPPGKHVCLYQATSGIYDTISNTNFGFRATYYKLKFCGEGHQTGMEVSLAEVESAGPVLSKGY